MRLIAGTPQEGRYLAAVEIKLAGNAMTYWRTPGDAGVPPLFSFDGSDNLAMADVAYPAPIRINEQGLDAFGYRRDVVFPIAVRARDAAKPVHLKLKMNYAVCDNICLPVRGVADLQLPMKDRSPEDDELAKAVARVPIPLPRVAVAKYVAIVLDRSAPQPRWILTWKGVASTDLFAEVPDGWDIDTHPLGSGRFSVIALQQPAHATRQVATQFTLTAPQKAYAFTLDLDLPLPASSTGTK